MIKKPSYSNITWRNWCDPFFFCFPFVHPTTDSTTPTTFLPPFGGPNLFLHHPVSTNEKQPPNSALCNIVRISHLLTYFTVTPSFNLLHLLLHAKWIYGVTPPHTASIPKTINPLPTHPIQLQPSSRLTSLDMYSAQVCTTSTLRYFIFPNRCKEVGYNLEMSHLSLFVRGKCGWGGRGPGPWVVCTCTSLWWYCR